MSKTVPPSKFSEWRGLDRISMIVHEMKCIYRELSKDDFGVDAEIEVVVPKSDGSGFETSGGVIKAQSKSGESYIKGDTPTSFHTPVEKRDLTYWSGANFPVILIVYHPKDDALYWKDVRTYVRTTFGVFQPPLKVDFDKTTDRFDRGSYDKLCELAQISPPRISTEHQELLYSNLLHVKRLPNAITYAPTKYRSYGEIRSKVDRSIPPYRLVDGCLYTLADLRDPHCALRPFCDTSDVHDLLTRKWVHDDLRRNDVISLLNQLLRKHAGRCGIRYNPDFKRYYFPREDETSLSFEKGWRNVRTHRDVSSRTVAKYYQYGIDMFWRHLAANLHFRYVNAMWYLEIVPKYFFTEDGVVPCDSDKVGPYTTKIKALERNIHVLNHVLFWVHALSNGQDVIEFKLGTRVLLQVEKIPVTGVASFAIPSDPAIYDEPVEAPQLGLFDSLFSIPEDDDDDDYFS